VTKTRREPSQTPALLVSGLGHSYAGTPVLDGVELVVGASAQTGELVALLGTSGSGKSTLLRSIAGFVTPTRGRVAIGGVEVVSDGRERVPAERRRVGMVFQDYALFAHMSVAENVAFGLHGLPRAEQAARVARQLERVGLGDRAHERPTRLSGGQRQRVALARALAPEPTLILLDEPFANIDEDLRRELGANLRGLLAEQGVNALLVTHDCRTALGLADRVAVIGPRDAEPRAPGGGPVSTLLQVGTPAEVYRRPASAIVGRLTGPVVTIPGEASGAAARTPLGPVALAQPAQGPVTVLLRPEELGFALAPDGRAVVVQRTFRGSSYELTLRTPAGDLVLERPADGAYEVGARGEVKIAPGVVGLACAPSASG
jgi:iron(III) transport system ATP-binding protein